MTGINPKSWEVRFPGMAERCTQLFHEDTIAQKVADILSREFNAKVTRNMVIGHWHRNNLYVGADKRGERVSIALLTSKRLRVTKRAQRERELARPILFPEKKLPKKFLPKRPKKLLELTNECCRWPFGEPGTEKFFFCGRAEADILANRPYCREHTTESLNPRPLVPLKSLPD